MGEPEERLVAEIPGELKRLVDADSRSNKQVVIAALWNEFGGKKKNALETQKELKEQRLQALDEERNALDKNREKLVAEINALDAKIEETQTAEEAYESALDDLLDRLEGGELTRLQPVVCEDVADEHGKNAEDVWADSKQRAANQDRELYNVDFMAPREARKIEHDPEQVKRIADAVEEDGDGNE